MPAYSQWILDAIHPFTYDVASLVPPVFEAYARVFHPAYEKQMHEPSYPVSWKAVANANNRIVHPAKVFGIAVRMSVGSPFPLPSSWLAY
jgi:hypothetical protein